VTEKERADSGGSISDEKSPPIFGTLVYTRVSARIRADNLDIKVMI